MNLSKNIMLLLIIGALISCRKDSEIILDGEATIATVDGFISDENNFAIANALIEVAGTTTQTDANGYFKLENIEHTGKVYIKASKGGYFSGSRTHFSSLKLLKTKIQLYKREYESKFLAEDGGIVEGNGVSLEFSPKSIVDSKGQLYLGKVTVAIKYLDPSQAEVYNKMPGTLVGENISGEKEVLESFGMVGVWLADDIGNELNIKLGEKCKIKVPIPINMQSYASNQIPLWHFDEINGLWKEDGQANKVNNYYEGVVSHFSFWNCDYGRPLARLTGRIVHNNIPLSTNISITIKGRNESKAGQSNDDGSFDALVPANEDLTLSVHDFCFNTISQQNLGIIDKDTYLGDVSVNTGSQSSKSINGVVLDCDGKPAMNAVVKVLGDGHTTYIPCDENGAFELANVFCISDVIKLRAILSTINIESEDIILSSGIENKNVIINACKNEPEEYMFMELSNGEKLNFIGRLYFTDDNYHSILGESFLNIFDLKFEEKISLNSKIKSKFYFANDKFIYRNEEYIGTTEFSSIQSPTSKYYEGTFTILGVKKQSKLSPNPSDFIEDNITLTGKFKFKI